jgi:hypothetical protein
MVGARMADFYGVIPAVPIAATIKAAGLGVTRSGLPAKNLTDLFCISDNGGRIPRAALGFTRIKRAAGNHPNRFHYLTNGNTSPIPAI